MRLNERRCLGPLTAPPPQFCVCSLEREACLSCLCSPVVPADQATLGGAVSQMEECLRSKDLGESVPVGVRGLVGGVGELSGCVMSGKSLFLSGHRNYVRTLLSLWSQKSFGNCCPQADGA